MGTENPWFSEGSLLALGNTIGPHPRLPLLWEPWGDQGGRAQLSDELGSSPGD